MAGVSRAGGHKKLWYCVVSTYDDRGRVTAEITAAKESADKPESTFHSNSRKDVYTDWFDSVEKAKAFVEGAKKA